MELQIQNLVDSIKHEGIEAAQKESDRIIAQAKADAAAIIKDAENRADQKIEEANKEIEILRQSAKVGAEQAKRDAALAFRKEVEKAVSNLLASDVKKALNEKALLTLIEALLKDEDVSSYEVEVADVSDALKSELSSLIGKGLNVKLAKNIGAGFRLVKKDGSGYVDCTDEELVTALTPFVSELNF